MHMCVNTSYMWNDLKFEVIQNQSVKNENSGLILFFRISEWFHFSLMHDWYKTGQEQTMETKPLILLPES